MIKFLKQLFCWHRWKVERTDRFAVVRGNGTVEGEISFARCICEKCGYETIVEHDRVHYAK